MGPGEHYDTARRRPALSINDPIGCQKRAKETVTALVDGCEFDPQEIDNRLRKQTQLVTSQLHSEDPVAQTVQGC